MVKSPLLWTTILSLIFAVTSFAKEETVPLHFQKDLSLFRVALLEDSETGGEEGSQKSESQPLERRMEAEMKLEESWYAITPHKTNYILPFTYNFNSDFSPYDSFDDEDVDDLRDSEIKFQISLKSLVWPEILGTSSNLWIAYTQESYWQLYASEISAPFRETNHEPELIWSLPVSFEVFGFDARFLNLAFVHQSNGRGGDLSRSWNRITGSLVAERGNLTTVVKPWWRLQEDKDDDDNPDIERYIGQIEIGSFYKYGDHTFAFLLNNNLRTKNRSGLQLDWSFPLNEFLKGYVQFFTGYGENLIDAENNNTRIGVGIMLTDWL